MQIILLRIKLCIWPLPDHLPAAERGVSIGIVAVCKGGFPDGLNGFAVIVAKQQAGWKLDQETH